MVFLNYESHEVLHIGLSVSSIDRPAAYSFKQRISCTIKLVKNQPVCGCAGLQTGSTQGHVVP